VGEKPSQKLWDVKEIIMVRGPKVDEESKPPSLTNIQYKNNKNEIIQVYKFI
jgi:hypothetical protein